MKKTIMLCNNMSSQPQARPELMNAIRARVFQPCEGRVFDGKINDYFSSETAECISILANRNNTNPIVEIKSMFSVKRAVKEHGIDSAIIYGVKNHAAMAAGAKLGGAKRILCVVNGRGNLFFIGGFKGALVRAMAFPMLRLAYRNCCAVCFQNRDDMEFFLEKKLVKDRNKCFVTGGSGINLDDHPCESMPVDNRFLFLSRITPSKGIFEYIKAAYIVKEKYPDAIFDIVGPLDSAVEGEIGDILHRSVEEGVVNYHGYTNDVHSWMAKCRFFVYPSYYPEGVPRCAIQAIATGRPIITCDTPGCKETVEENVNGFRVPAKDVDALAERMLWFIEHPEQAVQMANESRKLAEEKFDVNKVNKELLDRLYDAV